jgi:hypothetical protein
MQIVGYPNPKARNRYTIVSIAYASIMILSALAIHFLLLFPVHLDTSPASSSSSSVISTTTNNNSAINDWFLKLASFEVSVHDFESIRVPSFSEVNSSTTSMAQLVKIDQGALNSIEEFNNIKITASGLKFPSGSSASVPSSSSVKSFLVAADAHLQAYLGVLNCYHTINKINDCSPAIIQEKINKVNATFGPYSLAFSKILN